MTGAAHLRPRPRTGTSRWRAIGNPVGYAITVRDFLAGASNLCSASRALVTRTAAWRGGHLDTLTARLAADDGPTSITSTTPHPKIAIFYIATPFSVRAHSHPRTW